MLILTRRVHETIRIGEDVVVTVLSVEANQVKIGVAAPREVAVQRQEVYERIQGERVEPDEAIEPARLGPIIKFARRHDGWQ